MRWEYRVKRLNVVYISGIHETLNCLGNDGWEMTGIIPSSFDAAFACFYFKRPLKFSE